MRQRRVATHGSPWEEWHGLLEERGNITSTKRQQMLTAVGRDLSPRRYGVRDRDDWKVDHPSKPKWNGQSRVER
jgi:hypothetical protein